MFCTGKKQLTCNSEKLGCEGCFYFNDGNNKEKNMKENLKILEDFCEDYHRLERTHADYLFSMKEKDIPIQAIENLIARNEELEDDLYATNCIVNEQIDVLRESIPKSKVEELLEKLDKEEQELQNSISDEEREEYSDAMISWELCDIDGKRKMLQELLKK